MGLGFQVPAEGGIILSVICENFMVRTPCRSEFCSQADTRNSVTNSWRLNLGLS